MPKSSIASRTPSALSSLQAADRQLGVVPSARLSVISSVERARVDTGCRRARRARRRRCRACWSWLERQVDAHRQRRLARERRLDATAPGGSPRAAPSGRSARSARLLGERMKSVGAIRPRSGMVPAQQRLDAGDGAVVEAHDRLVVQLELVGRPARAGGRHAAPAAPARPRASRARTRGSRPCRRAWRCTWRRPRCGSARRRRDLRRRRRRAMPMLRADDQLACRPSSHRQVQRLEDPLGHVGRLLAAR